MEYFILDLVWIRSFFVLKFVWADLYLGFSAGAAISFTFDCFSILTQFLDTMFQLSIYFPDFFFHFFNIQNSVGRMLILNSVLERLSRSRLTAFRF